MSLKPYGNYAVLKFPNLFEKFEKLDMCIGRVGDDEIYDLVTARKENLKHFNAFVKTYESQRGYNKQTLKQLKTIQEKAQKMSTRETK